MMEELDAIRARLIAAGSLDLIVRVRPHAAKTQLTSVLADGSVKIDVAAPAEEGRGNLMLRKFLAEAMEVPASNIKLLSGKTSRMKLVRITV